MFACPTYITLRTSEDFFFSLTYLEIAYSLEKNKAQVTSYYY